MPGSRGETPSLPFLCRRFFSQTEKKCRNAGSVKSLIIVGREGSKPIISKSKLLYRLPPISDSRKGCPYEVRGLKFVRIFERRTKFAPTVCKTSFSEDFMPLSRQRCVESPHPTNCATIKLCEVRGRMKSAPTAYIYYFEQSEITPQSRLRRASSPTGEPNRFCDKSKSIKPIKLARLYTLQKKNDL